MSYWTYVSGTVMVHSSLVSQPHSRYVVDTVLEHLPCVSGSEGNMNVHVVQSAKKRCTSSANEFGEPMCFRHNSRNEWMDVYGKYILVLEGTLRDRSFDETKKELSKWLCRLAKRIWVRDVLVKLEDDSSRKLLITDATPYADMLEPWSSDPRSNGEPAWTEYLYWDAAKGSWYPMALAYKYWNDPENDAEYERRLAFMHD